MRILHLSDPHFGTAPEAVSELLLRSVHALEPEAIILSGDITQRATEAEFQAAAAFARRLPDVPLIAVPGNHDIPLYNLARRLFVPYGRFVRAFEVLPPFAVMNGQTQLIALNSAPPWRHINGELNVGELERQLVDFTRERAAFRIAVFHHPLDCRRKQDRHNLVRGAAKICRVLSDYGIDLVLGGHIHDPLMRCSDHLYPGVEPRIVFLLAGTCISSRTRVGAPNSFNLIETEGPQGELVIERRDLDPSAQEFHPVQRCRFLNTTRGWQLGQAERLDHPDRPDLPVS